MREARPKRRCLAWREIRGDIYSCGGGGSAYLLEGVAADIWRMSDGTSTIADITRTLARRYGVDLDQVAADVTEFIAEACRAGIVEDEDPREPRLDASKQAAATTSLDAVLDHGWVRDLPLKVDMEITYRCPLRCLHCYNAPSVAAALPPGGEMTADEYVGLFGSLREAGTFFVTLTGGEPLAHPHFARILEAAAEGQFCTSIITNGTLVTGNAAAKMHQCKVWRVQVSLQGGTPEIHDRFVQTPGAFKLALRAVQLLRDAGVMVEVSCVATAFNFDSLGALVRLMQDMDVPLSIGAFILPELKGALSPLRWRLSSTHLRELMSRGWFDLRKLTCTVGKKCAIRPDGTVTPCLILGRSLGNVRRIPFSEVWDGVPRRSLLSDDTFKPSAQCAACRHHEYCHRCPGAAEVEMGDARAPVPFACTVAEAYQEVGGARGSA